MAVKHGYLYTGVLPPWPCLRQLLTPQMKHLLTLFSPSFFACACLSFAALCTTGAQAQQKPLVAVLDSASKAQQWPLRRIDPSLPKDWTGYNYLVLQMRVSSPEGFDLNIFDAGRKLRLMVYPMQGPWIQVCIPLHYYVSPDTEGFDMASLGNKSAETFFLGMTGTYGSLKNVTAIGVQTRNPVGKVTLEFRSIRLSKTFPGNDVLEPKTPVVDAFGQWIPAEDSGRVRSMQQLQEQWHSEQATLLAGQGGDAYGYGKFGGYRGTQLEATGFFRVVKHDGRWWLVDPEGLLFFSSGANLVTDWSGTFARATSWRGFEVASRESLFEELPPASLRPPPWAWDAHIPQVSFFTWNLQRRFGQSEAQRREAWMDFTFRRMADWGLNTLGNWSDPEMLRKGRAPYVFSLYGWGIEDASIMGMPDVYSKSWEERVERKARELCSGFADDPWLIGYFLGNEPPWPGRESVVVDAILAGADSATRRHLEQWLAQGDTPQRRVEWVYGSFKRFLDVVIAAVRRHDPDHLILGMRYAAYPPKEMLEVSAGFDVISINSYLAAPDPKLLERIAQVLDKPVMIGEFHFGTPSRGLAGGLAVVQSHRDRGVAYQYYMEQAAANPAVVGAHWFQWVDQPVTGRLDGERYNTGFVDVTDRPYPELVEFMRRTHARLKDIHSGAIAPVNRKAD